MGSSLSNITNDVSRGFGQLSLSTDGSKIVTRSNGVGGVQRIRDLFGRIGEYA